MSEYVVSFLTLFPCPFCGHEAEVSSPAVSSEGEVRAGTIACSNLVSCFTPHVVFGVAGDRSETEAIELWNQRTVQPIVRSGY